MIKSNVILQLGSQRKLGKKDWRLYLRMLVCKRPFVKLLIKWKLKELEEFVFLRSVDGLFYRRCRRSMDPGNRELKSGCEIKLVF